jgi:ketosteroid isomerase-like protein
MRTHNRRPMYVLVAGVSLLLSQSRADAQNAASNTGSLANRDVAAIRAELDTMAAGWNRGDLSVYLSGYEDSIATRGPGGFVIGVPAVERVMRGGYWKTGRPAQTLHFEHFELRRLSSDVAIATGEYVLSGGGQDDHTGWFTTVWKRTTAGWRCVHDHSSS